MAARDTFGHADETGALKVLMRDVNNRDLFLWW
jgi:hypothetical protein